MYGSVQPSTCDVSHQSVGPSGMLGSDGLTAQGFDADGRQPNVASNLESSGGAQPVGGHASPGPPLCPIAQLLPAASQPHLAQKRVAARPSSGMSKSRDSPAASRLACDRQETAPYALSTQKALIPKSTPNYKGSAGDQLGGASPVSAVTFTGPMYASWVYASVASAI